MKKKGMYRYITTDGRIALSPEPLYLALNSKLQLELAKVDPMDYRKLTLIADPMLAHLLTITANGDLWFPPEKVLQMSREELVLNRVSTDRNCCVLQDDTIYLYYDGNYQPLAALISKASREELIGYLWDVAVQAALAQIERTEPKQEETP